MEMNKMNEFKKLDLKPLDGVPIEKLLLDPNNPRFSKHPEDIVDEEKMDDKEIQEKTFRLMLNLRFNFEITELAGSIKSRGFCPVDNIFVKKINGKYKVVEGNRRITAIKLLLIKHEEGNKRDILPDEILDTLTEIDCFDLTNNSDDEIDFVLGLRHHGSIKKWGFLPSAFNIYKRYVEELSKVESCQIKGENFRYVAKIARTIAKLYSLKLSQVRDKLRAYRAYLQLMEITNDPDLDQKFSIIHDTIKNKTLRENFKFDTDYCTFDDEGADEFVDLICGSEGDDPVITASASGESNLRDLAYVVDNGTETDLQRITEDKEKASAVKADVKSLRNERNLINTLDLVLKEFRKIPFGEIKENGLSESEKEVINFIQGEIDKLKKHM